MNYLGLFGLIYRDFLSFLLTKINFVFFSDQSSDLLIQNVLRIIIEYFIDYVDFFSPDRFLTHF